MTATLEPTTTRGAKAPTASPAEVIRKAHEAGVQVVDVRFCDLPGTWQHFSIPLKELTADVFTEGLGFDGSSIRACRYRRSRSPATSWIPSPASPTPAIRGMSPVRPKRS